MIVEITIFGTPSRIRTLISTSVVSRAIHYTNGANGAACGNRTHDKRLEISCVTSTPMPQKMALPNISISEPKRDSY